jgi:hypothetical protein
MVIISPPNPELSKRLLKGEQTKV